MSFSCMVGAQAGWLKAGTLLPWPESTINQDQARCIAACMLMHKQEILKAGGPAVSALTVTVP